MSRLVEIARRSVEVRKQLVRLLHHWNRSGQHRLSVGPLPVGRRRSTLRQPRGVRHLAAPPPVTEHPMWSLEARQALRGALLLGSGGSEPAYA